MFDDCHERSARTGAADRGFALTPPDGAVVGLDLDERHVEAGDTAEVRDVLSFVRDRRLQPAGPDAGDLHLTR